MKSSTVDQAISAIRNDQSAIPYHLIGLSRKERSRVLMYLANLSVDLGYESVLHNCLRLLGFRDEEVLIFASACIRSRPQMVVAIVKAFVRDKTVARGVLGQAARALIRRAQDTGAESSNQILHAVHCVVAMREKIEPNAKGEGWQNDATALTLFILAELDQARKTGKMLELCDLIERRLRGIVNNEPNWHWLNQKKFRMDCK